jgi:hypothetical protein
MVAFGIAACAGAVLFEDGARAQVSTPTPAPPAAAAASATPPALPEAPTAVDATSSFKLKPDNIPRPGDIERSRTTISWVQGIGSADEFEIERADLPPAGAKREFTKIGLVPFSARASTRFTFEDPRIGFFGGACYRVRAVLSGRPSPYSAEACVPVPPTSGHAPSPPGLGSGHAATPARPSRDALAGGVAAVSASLFFAVLMLARSVATRKG